MQFDRLAQIIETVYETSLDPGVWPRAMEMVADALGGSCSTLLLTDMRSGAIPFSAAAHLPEGAADAYLDHWAAVDTIRQHGSRLPVGIPQTEEEMLGPRTAEVYNDYYLQWGWGHILGMYLLREEPLAATLSVYRSPRSSPFDESDRRAATNLGRHLGRAVQIQQKLAAAYEEREMVFEGMERLSIGVVFVGAGGRVLLMNRAAREIMAEADGLSIDHGELIGKTGSSTKAIRELIAAALQQAIDAPMSRELAVGRPSGKRSYVLLASAVRNGPTLQSSPKAIVLITDSDREIPEAADTLRELYALTPSEAALAVSLCEGRTLKGIAAVRQVSIHTVHTQLTSIQRKIGANRQTEVVSVLLRGPLGIIRHKESRREARRK